MRLCPSPFLGNESFAPLLLGVPSSTSYVLSSRQTYVPSHQHRFNALYDFMRAESDTCWRQPSRRSITLRARVKSGCSRSMDLCPPVFALEIFCNNHALAIVQIVHLRAHPLEQCNFQYPSVSSLYTRFFTLGLCRYHGIDNPLKPPEKQLAVAITHDAQLTLFPR